MKAISLTVQLITISLIALKRQSIYDKSVERNQWNNTYDFIVVGAGSAGCVVASRLSEDPNISVLLIEAGGRQTVISDMPAMAKNLRTDPEYDWSYKTVPQKFAAQAFVNQELLQSRGRVLGGTSTINWFFYNRGNRLDFDNWVDRYGAKGWSYEEVLPYFLKSENNTDLTLLNQNSKYHSTDGFLTVSSVENSNPLLLKLQNILKLNGYPTIDLNGESQLGTAIGQMTINDGRRVSTASAFIDPFIERQNLDVVTNAIATQIQFSDSKGIKRAHKLRFIKNKQYFTVEAKAEIIISCGPIESPKLLMLSGIGPKEHLRELNISQIADLPVGHNYRDHIGLQQFPLDIIDPHFRPNSPPYLNIENLYNYFVNGFGPLTDMSFSLTYLNSKYNLQKSWPDIALHLSVGNGPNNVREYVNRYASNIDQWIKFWEQYSGKYYLNLGVSLYRVKSEGTLRLRSSNPFDDPLVDPNFFSNVEDFDVFVDGFKQSLKLVENFSDYVTIPKIPIPGCNLCPSKKIIDCDSYCECVLSQISDTYNHPIGTCRMGSELDEKAVVNQSLKVRKVLGLRVIDSSVMPDVPNAMTNAASIMIGEYGSQMIKNDRFKNL